jgi:hypothetical protein
VPDEAPPLVTVTVVGGTVTVTNANVMYMLPQTTTGGVSFSITPWLTSTQAQSVEIVQRFELPELTAEQQAEIEALGEQRRRENEERRRVGEERDRQRGEAETRARQLLETLLNETQLAMYRQHEYFEVVGSAGNRYRIVRGNAGNVHWLDDDGQVLGELCAHPSFTHGWLPIPDVAAGQLLALITDEPTFIGIANVHEGRRPIFQD